MSAILLVFVLAIAAGDARAALPEPSYAAITDEQTWSARYAHRMPERSASAVARTLADAQKNGLPTEPIEATAREGLARGIAPERIVAAVHAKATMLASARDALGSSSTESELVAGATAIAAGIAPDSLTRLRALRPRSTVVPLVVMSDLVARGASCPIASAAVLRAARAGVKDDAMLRLREHIASDIGAGAAPADAILLRTRSFVPLKEVPAQSQPRGGPNLRTGDGP